MPDVYANETGIAGFTYDDAYSVILDSMKRTVTAPENMSRLSTISGPSNAAIKSHCNLKEFLGNND